MYIPFWTIRHGCHSKPCKAPYLCQLELQPFQTFDKVANLEGEFTKGTYSFKCHTRQSDCFQHIFCQTWTCVNKSNIVYQQRSKHYSYVSLTADPHSLPEIPSPHPRQTTHQLAIIQPNGDNALNRITIHTRQ